MLDGSNIKGHNEYPPTHLDIANKAIIVILYFAQLQEIQAGWKKVSHKCITVVHKNIFMQVKAQVA